MNSLISHVTDRKVQLPNMIINGDREETVALFKAMNPLVLDVLPLTLEEVFTYEMESLGYEFESALRLKNNE